MISAFSELDFFILKESEEAKREDVAEKSWKGLNDLGSLGKEPGRIGDWKRGLCNFGRATQRWFGFLFACLFYCFPFFAQYWETWASPGRPSTPPALPSLLSSPQPAAICLR